MAEKAADLICQRLDVQKPCTTHEKPLPDSEGAQWTQPGLAPSLWLRNKDQGDTPLCECELMPRSVIDAIVTDMGQNNVQPGLKAISLRSRMGKGPCQGTFCSQQVTAHLYDGGILQGREGLAQIGAFLRERWRGQRVLLWDTSLGQAELLEAMHCGLFGLELEAETSE